MSFFADLHLHSKYSRAVARDADLETYSLWAQKKGIAVIGTGDFTHPAWFAELEAKLRPAEPGLFRLPEETERAIASRLPGSCREATRFMLSTELSTIYKRGDKTRKIHHCVYADDLDAVRRLRERLGRIGNLNSDGRPILGLDSRDLLETVLESGDGMYLVPAHVWTPWFAVLGSRSGFDSIEECYGELSSHIFAVETGLSSDPPMNWRVSALDRYRLVSNSDAHSPSKLGRECNVFDSACDYYGIRRALETGEGYGGTVEVFPEEGKYHLDGHRACGVRLEPGETRRLDGRCPECGKPLTVGVLHRVEELADRDEPGRPATAGAVRSLVPLEEVLAELSGVGPKSKTVRRAYDGLVTRLGPELAILDELPLDALEKAGSPLLAEAMGRLRAGRVSTEGGYDGEYGVIRLFEPRELRQKVAGGLLFEAPAEPGPSPKRAPAARASKQQTKPVATAAPAPPTDRDPLLGLDDEQRRAASIVEGPLLIVAGPGSGKTRTLTHRIAWLMDSEGVPPEQCLTVTFTRRAGAELRARLGLLLPGRGDRVPVHTFHSLGHAILRAESEAAGLSPGFRVASALERAELLASALGVKETKAARLVERISRSAGRPMRDEELALVARTYRRVLDAAGLIDFDDLIDRALSCLEGDKSLVEAYRERWPFVSIDEFQDVDARQYRLVKCLAPAEGNLCVIGDPDQAIYGFRGADVRFFECFVDDWPTARVVRLKRNYRSGRSIVEAASQVMAGSEAEPAGPEDRRLVTLHVSPSARAEAEFVAHTIEQLLGGHSFFFLDSRRSEGGVEDHDFGDFAVLTRTDAQADVMVEALVNLGLPFARRSHALLGEEPAVVGLVRALAETGGGSLVERLEAAAELVRRDDEFDEQALRAARELVEPLARSSGDDEERFRSELALATQMDTWDQRADRISLLTLHAAKGLEFRVVFLAGCEDGILPLRFGSKLASSLEEERRLFYVGMTRAREQLYLCRARKRLWQGRLRGLEPTPWLAAIEERLLERRTTRLKQKAEPPEDRQLRLFESRGSATSGIVP